MADSGSSPDRSGNEPTVAGDPETLAMMQRIEASLFDRPAQPVRVGRFVLDRVLGSGGMGVVHLAYDDVLDRRLAIKLIRGERVPSDDLRARLLREARAMARLSHANVVQVYEAGEHEGHVFVAMELVEGGTMATWLRAQAKPWRERLAVLVAAGQGLAAAHRAGLVHRDFKPDNVLLAKTGEAKVADFGLAGIKLDVPTASSVPSGIEPLTVTGSLVGTPRYMAPEQLLGRVADARSDQFAFCIVAYEALVGQRPFEGETFFELSANVISGALRALPRDCRVPRSLLAVIERGLASDPARRWSSMDALLDALSRRRSRAPRLAMTLLVAVPALAFVLQRSDTDHAPCASDGLAGVWDAARREQTRDAFDASGKAYAADTFARVAPVLDTYASTWSDADVRACTSAHTGDPIASQRVACLDHARSELQFVTDDLAMGEPHAVLHAVDLAGALPELVRCDDPERAGLDIGSLEDPELRAAIDELGHASVLLGSRRLAEADALLLEVQAEAAAHRRDALEARAFLLRSKAAIMGGAHVRAREHAAQALALAERAERDDIAVEAWQALTRSSRLLDQFERAAFELDRAESIAARTDTDLTTRGHLYYDRGALLGEAERHAEAIADYRRAVEAWRAVNPEYPAIADALSDMATSLLMSGAQDEAIAVMEESLATRARQQGDSHPQMKSALVLAGNQYVAAGRFEDALRMNRRALAIAELYPEDRPDFIPALAALAAQNLVSLGRFDEARAMLEHAEELAERHASTTPEVRSYIALALSNLHFDRRELALAIPRYEAAIALAPEGMATNRAIATSNLAHALAGVGRIDEALSRSAAAVAATRSLAVESPPRIGIDIYDADVHRMAGRTDAARAEFQLALAVIDHVEVDAEVRFMAYFGAARLEPDHEIALAHAEKAAAALDKMPSTAWQREEFSSWTAEHRR